MTMSPSTATPAPQPPHERIPEGVFCAADYERLAVQHIAAPTHAYVVGGSGHDVTLAANRAAFGAWAICPRVLADVSQGHTRLSLPGAQALAHPLLLAPVAYQSLVHPQGELASAQAAEATQAAMVVSTLASHTLEGIAHHAGPACWFQLYLQPERAATLDLLRRAEAAGYTAVVLTLDASIQVPSLQALHAGFRMPPHVTAVNLRGTSPAPDASSPGAGHSRIFQGVMRQAPTWADVDWLLTQTALPLWIKGVLHPDDAVALKARGVAGLVVSNHGGRGLDGAPASLRMLPKVRQAVPGIPLLFDGGIRSGADVFKALALGANAVLIGRLQLYALAVAGALGVAHMLQMLRDELEICMAQAGCAKLGDIGPAALVPVDGATP